MARVIGFIGLGVLVSIIAAIVLYNVMFPSYSYRYRLSISIEADGQLHTASSIIEVIWRGRPAVGDVGPF